MDRVFQVRRPYWDHVKVKKKNQKGFFSGKQIFEKERERGVVIYSGGVKDGGSNYQIWRLQISNNLATNPSFFLPC